MAKQTGIAELLARWDSGEGKPYKGSLIDWPAYEANPDDIGCMCAQGQVLSVLAGWEPAKLRQTQQSIADRETAKLLNISRAHAVLLRNINDRTDGAPSVVLTDPGKVLGDQWSKLLDFWRAFDQFDVARWKGVAAARAAAGAAAWDAARDAARAAARAAAGGAAWAAVWDAAGDAAGAAAGAAAWDAARDAARAAAGGAAGAAAGAAVWDAAGDAAGAAAGEIQGAAILFDRRKPLFFLPVFSWNAPENIPARPADYGLGLVPAQ